MQLDVDVSPPAFSLTRCAYTGFNLGNGSWENHYQGKVRYWLWPDFMTLSLIVLEILAILNFGPVTTDGKRCIRAHRALAQVGSKSKTLGEK